jgi:hypothetical protein
MMIIIIIVTYIRIPIDFFLVQMNCGVHNNIIRVHGFGLCVRLGLWLCSRRRRRRTYKDDRPADGRISYARVVIKWHIRTQAKWNGVKGYAGP